MGKHCLTRGFHYRFDSHVHFGKSVPGYLPCLICRSEEEHERNVRWSCFRFSVLLKEVGNVLSDLNVLKFFLIWYQRIWVRNFCLTS
jgi:hypothetical protein